MTKTNFNAINLLSFGTEIQIVGAVLANAETAFIAPYPAVKTLQDKQFTELDLSVEDWQALTNQLDTALTEVSWSGQKALFRKCQRTIDSVVCWQVYKRDGFHCRYCGHDDVPLTVDHIILWENGGPSVSENLISACKRCNRERGSLEYSVWLDSEIYERLSVHLSGQDREKNLAVVDTLAHLATLKAAPRTKRK